MRQVCVSGLYAVRFTDPGSSQQPDSATRISFPVHTIGPPGPVGASGTSDHVPALGGTIVVVVVGAGFVVGVVVGAGVVVVGAVVVGATTFVAAS